jgi:hypothetical protein
MQVGGLELLVETTQLPGTQQTAALGRAQAAVSEAFDRAQSAIVAIATSTVGTISRLGQHAAHPDEMTVVFGLKFSAQGNVIVAGATGEATLEVSLTYKRDANSPATDPAIEASADPDPDGTDQDGAGPGAQLEVPDQADQAGHDDNA